MSNTDLVVIRFTHDAKLLLKGHWVLYGRNTVNAIGGFLLATLAILYVTWNAPQELGLVLRLGPILWLLVLYVYLLQPWLSYRKWVQQPNVRGEREITVDNTALKMKAIQGQARYAWSAFRFYKERPEFFVLRLGKKQMIVIPKSGFANDADLARFRRILSNKIGAAGRRPS